MTSDELARFDNQILEARAAEKKAVQEVERLRVELRSRDERIRELEQQLVEAKAGWQALADMDVAIGRQKEQQLRAAQERLAEAEGLFASTLSCFKDTLSELRHTPEPCHPACRMCTRWMPDYDKTAQAAEEYFAKHSAEKTESG